MNCSCTACQAFVPFFDLVFEIIKAQSESQPLTRAFPDCTQVRYHSGPGQSFPHRLLGFCDSSFRTTSCIPGKTMPVLQSRSTPSAHFRTIVIPRTLVSYTIGTNSVSLSGILFSTSLLQSVPSFTKQRTKRARFDSRCLRLQETSSTASPANRTSLSVRF